MLSTIYFFGLIPFFIIFSLIMSYTELKENKKFRPIDYTMLTLGVLALTLLWPIVVGLMLPALLFFWIFQFMKNFV